MWQYPILGFQGILPLAVNLDALPAAADFYIDACLPESNPAQ